MTFVAWVVFPLVLYLVAAGLGLLAERRARAGAAATRCSPRSARAWRCSSSLGVLAVGGAGAIMGSALVALGAGGAGRSAASGCATRLAPGWPAIAALLAFALYMGPVVLSGHWTWLGYNFVNDTANNLALADHLAHHGIARAVGRRRRRR